MDTETGELELIGDPEDTIKIMLATDNHIGYLERDPIRGQDAMNTFEEILKLAVKHDVDFILLGGDLFHENRPSRDVLYRVIALLREYTLGNKPIQIQLLSDPDDGKPPGFSFPAINYEDPNLNVSIPTFSIHGNHDDPQGSGPDGALCALDLLSVTGLLNYIGKNDLPTSEAEAETAGLAVQPVLLQKGRTRLGLYGMGNVKDARMHFELRSNRVRMYMPRDKADWFNVLLVHQNRVRHGPQESVPEGMFDDNIHLVVWGHEHDCRIEPESVAGKDYEITQPGSSVATSLADGESLEKHVALVQICGQKYKLHPIPLRTVRPFVLDEVWLTESAEEKKFDVNDQIAVSKFLKAKVNELIDKANLIWEERNEKALENGEEKLPPMLPLVRLKVDTTGVSEMSNPIRFGQEFQGRVANPRDVLVFHRAKKLSRNKDQVNIDAPELSIDNPNMPVAEKLAKVRVQTLVQEYLAAQELQLLMEAGMSDAIQTFVEKDDPHSIHGYVSKSLKNLLKGIQENKELTEDNLDEAVNLVRKAQEANYTAKKRIGLPQEKPNAATGDSDAASVDSMMMEVDVDGSEFEEAPPPPKKPTRNPRAGSSATKVTKSRKTAVPPPEDSEDEIEEPPPTQSKKASSRAAVLKAPKRATAAKKKEPSATQQTTLEFPSARSRSSRTAATKARGKLQRTADMDDDSE